MFSKLISRSFSSLLIKNGTVLNADRARSADVLIRNGKIERVGVPHTIAAPSGCEVVDAAGKLLIPGGIDSHTHLQMPFMGTHSIDDFDAGTRAAVAGGTTCVVDFIIPQKGEHLMKSYERWRSWADPKVHCDYALHCAITSWTSDTPRQMAALVREGITTFKAFMAYKGSLMLTDEHLYDFFETCRDLGALAMVHCENGELIEKAQKKMLDAGVTGPEGHYLSRPDIFEAEATHRAITIAEFTHTPLYIVHCMSEKACEEIARARARGNILFGETLASALGTDGRQYWNPDWQTAANHVMSPPLNPSPETKRHLMHALEAGVLQAVSTDNCTFSRTQKQMGKDNFAKIPNGMHGLQDRLSVAWEFGVNQGRLSKTRFVDVTSATPAKLMNLYPFKGVIEEGADADLSIWDPTAERKITAKTHQHAIDYNVYEGRQITGGVTKTISRGKVVYDQGKIYSVKGQGKYVPRQPFGYAFERLPQLMARLDPKKQKVLRDSKGAAHEQPAATMRV